MPTASSTVPVAVDTTAPGEAIDATALLQAGLAKLEPGYHFTSVASVNGTPTVTADGDRIGAAGRYEVTTNGALVRYITTGTATYVQPDGGEWDKLGSDAPVSDPVKALAAPASITVVSQDGSAVRLKVSVSAAALGVGTSGEADMEVALTDGAITEIGYTTTVDGNVGSVATTIGPVEDSSPIVAPI
ncbi:MAG: hypothetical protein ACOYMR_03765 [Ilumatobacteraceae bacterium]